MKSRLELFMLFVALVCSSSCERVFMPWEHVEVDWSPVSLFIQVHDGQGNDLLDPSCEHNVIDGTYITFRGRTYQASREWYENGRYSHEPATKDVLPEFLGFFLVENSRVPALGECTGFSLDFGEIDGASDMDEDLV